MTKIIGICGLIGSGKGSVADILIGLHRYNKMSFADSLKDVTSAVFGWPRDLLEGDTTRSRAWREMTDQWWSARLGIPGLTPRWVLQNWGTELFRDGFHSDIWIASMERKILDNTLPVHDGPSHFNVVIPDTRFPNEIDMIRNLGGEVWLVRRGPDPDWLADYIMNGTEPQDQHPSEWRWARSYFDHIIYNNGTLDDLKAEVSLAVTRG
jgi:hypothetical protein